MNPMNWFKNDDYDVYYHLTTEDNIQTILKDGLEPRIGNNSSKVNEEIPAIYLCKKEDLNYWRILLNKPCVIKIKNIICNKTCNYGDFNEHIYYNKIPP